MLSLHHNAPRMAPSEVPGTDVFVQFGSAESERLGGLVYRSVVDSLSSFDVEWVAAADSGVMTVLNTRGTDAYGMLRYPNLPTALVELGYMANPAEADLFLTFEYVEAAAGAVAESIQDFLLLKESSVALGEGRVFNPQPSISRSRCVDPDIPSFTSLVERMAVQRRLPSGSDLELE